ncbi:SDR family NAD(P)-dependent oxidoreductase [Leifsonia sp. Root60]|uniref:SDR family NAD(P)-dependent oxidoreductase n=2 Tax=unclassified Leifsonia TaxID=2663824 RepID=UPI0006F9DA1D|nr:SDR family NAD(P)-dependent oxidoreductase [Leifsonia sp. Root60]KQX08399.1 short-chain dehydrogenase [Leifsonia sp. Root1293]KRA12681.1 short-chain dehydrogenase [Leifsonia sp. Root60]
MNESIVLITGTSSGIGLATAVAAAAAGARVVATMRDVTRAGRLQDAARDAGVQVDIRALDVTDAAAVGAVVDAVVAEHGRIDVLVNNAGAGHVGTIEQDSVDEYRAAMDVNYFGVVAMTKAALPHLRAVGGRVVTVTSVGGIVGQPFNEAYCAAKFAVEGFLESLAPVAASVGVSVSIVEPGAVTTEFAGNAGIGAAVERVAGTPYAPALDAYLRRTREAFDPAAAQTAAEVAAVIVDVIGAERPPIRVQTSAAAQRFVSATLRDLDGSAVQSITRGWIA